MGKIEWAAYKPESINWEARSRVEAWGRHNSPLELTRGKDKKDRPAMAGISFAIFMAVVMILTYIRFF